MSQWGKITLWDAAADGNLELVKKRLENSWTKINAQDAQGRTAISEAAKWGHLEVVKFLHSQGADLSIRDNGGCLPIHYAAFNGHDNVVDYILSQGKQFLNVQDGEGNTPLHRAAGRGHVSTVKLLLSHGANPKIKNHQGSDVYTSCQNVAVREVLEDKAYISPTKYES
jgi:tankyrase